MKRFGTGMDAYADTMMYTRGVFLCDSAEDGEE